MVISHRDHSAAGRKRQARHQRRPSTNPDLAPRQLRTALETRINRGLLARGTLVSTLTADQIWSPAGKTRRPRELARECLAPAARDTILGSDERQAAHMNGSDSGHPRERIAAQRVPFDGEPPDSPPLHIWGMSINKRG